MQVTQLKIRLVGPSFGQAQTNFKNTNFWNITIMKQAEYSDSSFFFLFSVLAFIKKFLKIILKAE